MEFDSAFEERRKKAREASARYFANLTPEKKEETRRKENARRKTPYYRNLTLLRTYGITYDAWLQTFIKQGSCCAICKTTIVGPKGWATDHCHVTGKFRGILCPACNRGLGLFKENITSLRNAIKYLKKGE